MKKIMKNVILTLLVLSLSVSTAFLVYLHFFALGEEELSGEWTADLDMSEQAAVTAFIWLQDIEAVSVSLEDMESRMQGLTIQVNLTLEQNSRTEGTFQCSIQPESYDACREAAYEAFAMAFQDLLVERLHMADYAGSTDRDSIEALVTETFGMSTVEYLMSCGPALLPSLEELQDEYDGSGTYEASEGILTRQFASGQSDNVKTERYIRKDFDLILLEVDDSDSGDSFSDYYPVQYILKQPE